MKKIVSLFLLLFLLPSLFSMNVSADVGPKPSVTVTIKNAPDKSYYVTFLGDREPYGPWRKVSDVSLKEDASDRDKAYAYFANYSDADGYIFLGNMSEDLKGFDSFSWTYYPPDSFKIAIYSPDDDTFFVSEICEREAFNSYFEITYGSPDVKEESHFGKDFFHGVLRALVTVAVELALGYLFGFREKKQILTILIVNLITQLLLNIGLMLTDYFAGALVWLVMFVILEIAVIVIEMIVYLFAMRKQKKWKLVLYAILANVLSGALTFYSVFLSWVGI